MDKIKLNHLIKQTVNEELLRESLVDLEMLHNGISNTTLVGKPWVQMIISLETVIDEVKDFKSMYSSPHHGPLPNIDAAMPKLQEMVKILNELKPVILGMDAIQKNDR